VKVVQGAHEHMPDASSLQCDTERAHLSWTFLLNQQLYCCIRETLSSLQSANYGKLALAWMLFILVPKTIRLNFEVSFR
jgi:hypothetical protein